MRDVIADAGVRRDLVFRDRCVMTDEANRPLQERDSAAPVAFSASSLIDTLCRPLMLALLSLACIFHLVMLTVVAAGRTHRFDFSVFYASAVAMRMGLNPYLIDLSRIGDPIGLEIRPLIHTTSTPTFLLCFEPFGYLPETVAYWIWFAINAVALGVSIMLLLRDRTGGLSRSRKWVLGIAMLLYAPLGDHIAFAQVQVLILLMLVLVMRCLASRREIAAGLILALAIMLRAFPIVLAGYLLATRRWRALGSMTLGVVLIGIVTTAGLGLNVVRSFLDGAMLTVGHHPVSLPINVAIAAFTTRLFWYAFGAALPAGLEVARRTVVVIVELAILGLGLRAAFRAASDRDADNCDADLAAFDLWVVIAVMLSPIAWIHYMVLFLIPFAQIAMAANRGACRPSTMWLFVASYFLIAASIGLRNPAGSLGGEGWFLMVAECAFVSVLLVFAAAYRLVLDRLALEGDKSAGGSRLSARAIG
jgi:hypothetical protein